MTSPYAPSYPGSIPIPAADSNVSDEVPLTEKLGLKMKAEHKGPILGSRLRNQSVDDRLKTLSQARMSMGGHYYDRMLSYMDPSLLTSQETVPAEDVIASASMPPLTFMELAEDEAQQSLPSDAIIPMSYDAAPFGATGDIADKKSPGNQAIARTIQGAAGERSVYERELEKMLGMPMGPTPEDIEKTYSSLYGKGSDINNAAMNIEKLQGEMVNIAEQEGKINQAKQAEIFELNAITEEELQKKQSITEQLKSDFKNNYDNLKAATAAVNSWVKSTRERYENEDPISAFRMFDWFKKEKNEAGEWEDSFQWSGFATTIASLAAIAGNVGVNMATKGQVPLFMVNMLMKAMDADLDAQRPRREKKAGTGNFLIRLFLASETSTMG